MPLKAKEYKPKRVRSEDDRQAFSSDYISIAEGEKFVGYALFAGDPKEDEKGYYEYMEHYDPGLGKRGGSVPCAEEGCPYCEDGERPRARAKTLWLVTQIGDKKLKKPELRIFNMSSISIGAMTEMRKEGDAIFGKLFRVSRVDDKNYLYTPKEQSLKKGEIKEHLKTAPDFEAMLTAQGRKIIEKLMVQRVMDDDTDEEDDDEEETTSKKSKSKDAKKSTSKSKVEDDEDDDEDEEDDDEDEDDNALPDEAEDESVIVNKVVTKGKSANTIVVEHEDYGSFTMWGTEDIDLTELSKGDVITVAWEKDEVGDYVIQAEPEVAGEEDDDEEEEEDDDANEGELPDEIEDEVFVITGLDADNETMDVENDELGLTFTLFFLDTVDVDFDDFEVGNKIKVSAEKDTQGDMVASSVPEAVKAKKAANAKDKKKSTAKSKGGKTKK